MNKFVAAGALIVMTTALAACSSGGADAPEETPAAAPSTVVETESPEPAAEVEESPAPVAGEETQDDALAFGSTTEVDFGGSVWSIQVDAPHDAMQEVEDYYANTGLERTPAEGAAYVAVSGTITRVGDGPASPFGEVSVDAIIDGQTIEPNGPSTDTDAVMDIGELFPDASAPFTEIWEVPGGSEINTVSVIVGAGEAGQRLIFGEPVDLGGASTEEADATTVFLELMDAWNTATPTQQAESAAAWQIDAGSVTDEGVAQLIDEAAGNGLTVTDDVARNFLAWALDNQ